MIWLMLLVVALQAFPYLISSYQRATGASAGWAYAVFTLLHVTIYVLLVAGVVLLLTAEDNNVVLILLCAILMLAPCANVLLLLLVNMSVTRTLRRAGLHVGFMGAKDEEVERHLNPMLCKKCGYNLTGNVSGICPECGRAIEQVQV